MNQKYILKFEQGILEQSYKLSEIDYLITDVSDIEKIIQSGLLENVTSVFFQMQSAIKNATQDYY